MPKWYRISDLGVRRIAEQSWLPEEGGCYALYADGELVYIGSSQNLKFRISTHLRSIGFDGIRSKPRLLAGKRIDTVKSWEVKLRPAQFWGEWATLEIRLIRRLRPRFNIAGIPRNARRA